MTTPRHPHADHLAAIAQHLDRTAEATAPHQRAGEQYTAPDGSILDRVYHHAEHSGVTFAYSVHTYTHTTDIAVMVKSRGIETRVIVSGTYPAEAIAHAAMSALRATIDTLTTAQQGEAA